MSGKKFIPRKTQKYQDGRTSFGGRINPAVTEFENRKPAGRFFAGFAENSLDESAPHARISTMNKPKDQLDRPLAPSPSYLSSPDMWKIAEEGRRRREARDAEVGR